MTSNLKEILEAYVKKDSFSVSETMELFNNGITEQIKNSHISDDLKTDFGDVYQDLCDSDYWEDLDDDCEQCQVIMIAFDFVLNRIIKEL